MKKLILLASLCPFIALSQETIPEKKEKRIGIGVFVTPEYHSILLKNRTRNDKTSTKMSASVGAQMNVTFDNNLVLRAGLGYSFRSFEYKMNDLIFGNMIDPQQGYTSTPGSVVYDISFHEIQLPVAVHYTFSKPAFIGGGIDLIFPFANEGYMQILHPQAPYHASYSFENPVNVALSVSAGYRFQLDKKLSLLLEPVFRINVRGYKLNDGHHYTAGLKTTLWIGGR